MGEGRRVRPLSARELETLVAELETLVAVLSPPDKAAGTQRLLGEAMDCWYPSHSSGVEVQPHNEVDENGVPVASSTPVERAVMRPDREARRSRALAVAQRDLWDLVVRVRTGLEAFDPDRSVATCPFGHALPFGASRCNVMNEDGTRCGGSETMRICRNPACGENVPPGEPFPQGRCQRCGDTWKRTGRERVPQTSLRLGADVLIEDGVFVGDVLDDPARLDGQLRSGATMTPTERSERARKAAQARWSNHDPSGGIAAGG